MKYQLQPNKEPDISFTFAGYKISMAKRHTEILGRATLSFLERHPPKICLYTGNNFAPATLEVKPPFPVDALIPCIVGDAVHNIRCALDYCWMGIWRAIGPSKKKKTLPMAPDAKEYARIVRDTLVAAPLNGMADFLIDTVQTHGEGRTALYSVNQLDNRDKHNMLIATLGTVSIEEIKLLTSRGCDYQFKNLKVIGGRSSFGLMLQSDETVALINDPKMVFDLLVSDEKNNKDIDVMTLLYNAAQQAEEVVKLFQSQFCRARSEEWFRGSPDGT